MGADAGMLAHPYKLLNATFRESESEALDPSISLGLNSLITYGGSGILWEKARKFLFDS